MSAIISPCGLYRYRLERDLGGLISGPTVAWIMGCIANDWKTYSRPLQIKQRSALTDNAQLVRNESTVREPEKQEIRALWGARHQDMQALERIYVVSRGHGRATSQYYDRKKK